MSTSTIEERVAALESEVARLHQRLERQNGGSAARVDDPWMTDVWGAFAGDPALLEAMELGRKYRDSLRPKPRRRRKGHNSRARQRSRHSVRVDQR